MRGLDEETVYSRKKGGHSNQWSDGFEEWSQDKVSKVQRFYKIRSKHNKRVEKNNSR